MFPFFPKDKVMDLLSTAKAVADRAEAEATRTKAPVSVGVSGGTVDQDIAIVEAAVGA